MYNQQYPGFLIQTLPEKVTVEKVREAIQRRFGIEKTNYRNGIPEVKIYSPPLPREDSDEGPKSKKENVMFSNAVVTGVLQTQRDIRRRVQGICIDGCYPLFADVDFGLERLQDSTFDANTRYIHSLFKRSYGEVPRINMFDKRWLDRNLGGMRYFDCFAVFEQSVDKVNRCIIKKGGYMIRYCHVTSQKVKELDIQPVVTADGKKQWRNLMIEFETPLDAIQAICYLNRNSAFSGKSFLAPGGKKCKISQEWIGKDGRIEIESRMSKKGYIPFEDFRPDVLNQNKKTGIQPTCMYCHRTLELLGIHPNFTHLTATCVCIKQMKKRASEIGRPIQLTSYKDFKVQGNGLFYSWPGEDFVRLSANKYYEQKDKKFAVVDDGDAENPVVYTLKGIKPQYESVAEFERTAYVVACFEHSYNNLQYFQHHQSPGVVRLVNPIEKREFRGSLRQYTQIRVELSNVTLLWKEENAFKIGGVTIVANPRAVSQLMNGTPAPHRRPTCSFTSTNGERRVAGTLKRVKNISNYTVEVELVSYIPLDMELRERDFIYLIPKAPTSEREGLRRFLSTWKRYRQRVESPVERFNGDITSVSLISDLDWELPEKPVGSLRCFYLQVEVDWIPFWTELEEKLSSHYVGADLELVVSSSYVKNKDDSSSQLSDKYPVLGKTISDYESMRVFNTRVVDIWTLKRKYVVVMMVILEGNLTPLPGACSMQLWSIRPVSKRRKLDNGFPDGYKVDRRNPHCTWNDEHDIHDMEDDGNDEEYAYIPPQQRDVRFQNQSRFYMEEFEKYNGGVCLDTRDYHSVVNNILEKPKLYPNLDMLDILLYKRRDVNHDPFVHYYRMRGDQELLQIAQNIYENRLNPFQRQSVDKAIRFRMSFTLGPPGTGKTYTMAMLVLILCLMETGIVFVTCASNYATQNAYETILKQKNETGIQDLNVCRMLSRSRERQSVIENLRNHVLDNEDQNQVHVSVHTNEKWEQVEEMQQLVEKVDMYGLGSLTLEEEQKWEEMKTELEHERLDEARVICATVGAGSDNRFHSLVERVKKRGGYVAALVVDECGVISQTSLLTVLTLQAERAVFFGDDKQLPAIAASQTTENANLGVSFFTLCRVTEYFQKHNPYTELLYQYRMAPPICQLSSNLMYNGELQTHPSVYKRDYASKYETLYQEFPELQGNHIGLYCYKSRDNEAASGLSKKNELECDIVSHLVAKLKRGGVHDIGVITMYDSQVQLLKNKLQGENILISSVDGFQGKESDAIILSMVRSNSREIGFTRNPFRLNVSVSRAKHFMLFVYDKSLYENCGVEQIMDFFKSLSRKYKAIYIK